MPFFILIKKGINAENNKNKKEKGKTNENRISTLLKTKMKGTRSSDAEHAVVQKEMLEGAISSGLLRIEALKESLEETRSFVCCV